MFNEKMFNFGKVYKSSFISELMFFKKDIVNDLLNRIGVDKYGFFDKSVNILNKMNVDAGMSEYELYGNYVTKYFNNSYNYKNIKTFLGGKYNTWEIKEI